MSTTASTTSSAPHPLRILIVVASLSGNTRELARMIAVQCRQVGHQVCLHEADEVQPPWLPAAEADLVLLGTWTDNAGRTPSEMKQWVAGVEHPQALAQVAVFGTGETQWGLEYYCGAVHRLRRYFNSAHPPLEIEQMPHGQRHALAINEWTAQVLAAVTPNLARNPGNVDHRRHHP